MKSEREIKDSNRKRLFACVREWNDELRRLERDLSKQTSRTIEDHKKRIERAREFVENISDELWGKTR